MLQENQNQMENAYQEEQSQRENYRQEKDYAEDQDRVLRTFNHWVILGNLYPYDLIAKEHDMLMPKRVFGKMSDCNREEWDEYKEIINLLEAEEASIEFLVIHPSPEK